MAPLFSRDNPGTLRDLTGLLCGSQAVAEYDAGARFRQAKDAYLDAAMRTDFGQRTEGLPALQAALQAACREAYLAMWAVYGEPNRRLPEWLAVKGDGDYTMGLPD